MIAKMTDLVSERYRMIAATAMILMAPVSVLSQIDTSNASWERWLFGPTPVVGEVYAMTATDSALYVGGSFSAVQSIAHPAGAVAKYEFADSTWDNMDGGVDGFVSCIVLSGTDVFVGGAFDAAGDSVCHSIARWDGITWHPLGDGVRGQVFAMCVRNGKLYAGGSFDTAGNSPARNIAVWDGASWSTLGIGCNGSVKSVAFIDSILIVGGKFDTCGSVRCRNIGRYYGSSWDSLGSGCNGPVSIAAVIQSEVYVGGRFDSCGSLRSPNLARWTTTGWSSACTESQGEFDGAVNDILSFDSTLTIVGEFKNIGSSAFARIVRRIDSTWTKFGDGLNGAGLTLAANSTDLFVAGRFGSVGGERAIGLVRWRLDDSGSVTNQSDPQVDATAHPAIDGEVTKGMDHVIRFTLEEQGFITIRLFNLAGQQVMLLFEGRLESGNHFIAADLSQLPNGVYVYELTTPRERVTRTVRFTR